MILGWGQPCRIILWWCDHSLALLPRFLEMQWVLLEVVSYVSWFYLQWLPLCLLRRRGMGRMASCTVGICGGVGLLSEDLCLSCLVCLWSHSDLMWFQGYSKDWSFLTMVSNLASGWPFFFAMKLRLRDSGIEVLFQTNLSRGLGKYPFSVSGWRGRSLKKNCTDSLRHVEPCGCVRVEWLQIQTIDVENTTLIYSIATYRIQDKIR